ncbi:MAG TPA: NAD-dependent epimerase/dehydratase family protein [Gaiellaceae bacterium]|nr:NAD-dependent epimerase/dehydratase family protein [Gaiellaceae bacterium]
MRVLVTGGAGFIGSHVVDKLQARGLEARIFDLVPSPHHGPEVETVIGDLCDRDAARGAIDGCEVVIHLAAMADVDEVAKDPSRTDRVNVHGTQVLLEAARDAGISRFVYASTIWVYGDAAGPEPVDEEATLGLPRHFYTATKIAGEMYTATYGELYGLEWTILRFGIPYGPRARPAAVVPAFTAKALAGQPLTIAGDGTQSRRFVYVEDLAEGVVAALAPAAADRVYNLVGRENTSVRSIARTIRDIVGDVKIVHVDGRAGDLRGGNVSGERAARELGWEPTTPFAEGVRRYVDWVTATDETPRVASASRTDGSAAAVLIQEPTEL